MKSKYEETLALQLRSEKIEFIREARFHPVRKWRFDFAIKHKKLSAKFGIYKGEVFAHHFSFAVEVDGGGWVKGGGRHSKDADYEKRNEATLAGIPVFYFTGKQVMNNTAIEFIIGVIETWSMK